MYKKLTFVVVALAVIYIYFNGDGFDPASIRDKKVLITGASSGIGEQVAYQYASLGARLFITARRQKLLEKVAGKCKELGAKQVEFVTSDLGEQLDRDRVIAEAKKRLGGLNHIILNHAIASTGLWLGSKENMTKLRTDLNVNFVSYVDLASQAMPLLMRSNGSIGVVSSIAGKIATAGFASYSTDKHALQGFFTALRQELLLRNTGVSVTVCVLGPVDTDAMKYTKEKKQEIIDKFYGGFYPGATAENTAVAIVRGVATRKYQVYYGRLACLLVAIHKIIPGYWEDYSGRMFLSMHDLL